jgi:hypothetical protein
MLRLEAVYHLEVSPEGISRDLIIQKGIVTLTYP